MSEKVILGGRKTEVFTLPETGAKITAYVSLTAADVSEMKISRTEDISVDESVTVLEHLIVEWNMYGNEEDEKPLDITKENIKQLPISDITYLITNIADLQKEEKKG